MQREDPIEPGKVIEMDGVRLVPYVHAIQKLRALTQIVPVYEPRTDVDGVPMDREPALDDKIPGAYIPLNGYAAIVRELHRQGYRLIRIEPDPE